jgi:FtsP/CotA-like multicopper oxidase with cupredoxin domain
MLTTSYLRTVLALVPLHLAGLGRMVAAGALSVLVVVSAGVPTRAGHGASPPPFVQPNSNTERAGVLRDGTLTVMLEAKEALWQLNGPDRPPMTVAVFAEPGKPPQMPGPLVRAAAGVEIHLSVHNTLSKRLRLVLPAAVRGRPEGPEMDSLVVEPGATELLTTRATRPGNYVYRGSTRTGARGPGGGAPTGLLVGALVIDTAGAPARERDRVFVIMESIDSLSATCNDTAARPAAQCGGIGRAIYTINGRSWPNTERVAAVVGDSLRWRVINASGDIHMMHLHGFYYRVDAFSGPLADWQGRPSPGQMVATQFLPGFTGMSMTWSPNRPGNWLFHCHYAVHTMPDSVSAAPDDPFRRGMTGLVLGANVTERAGATVAGAPAQSRHLRLVAIEDTTSMRDGAEIAIPSMRFLLEEQGRRVDAGPDVSPELDLVRGQPVAIKIVNRLREPTSVHWHGIEVQDSYVDGVPGFSGSGTRLAPAIAPGDSFIARFTPPRAGTFMYHAHFDEVREQTAGLQGALIVREPGATASVDEHVFFLKSSRLNLAANTPVEINGRMQPDTVMLHAVEINGRLHPDTVVLHAGRPTRLRLINLMSRRSGAAANFRLALPDDSARTRGGDTTLVWQPIAKDGFDRPAAARTPRPAQQVVVIGETYDFEFVPEHAGMLRLDVIAADGIPGLLRITVPIRVE